MTRTPVTQTERANFERTIELYASLIADLQEIIDKGWPSSDELPDAPVLDCWGLSHTRVPCIVGSVTGHPELEGGITTSALYAWSRSLGVARTQSRWYRLGKEKT
ncbi:MAG: DUF6634 family protein [Nisaea sp.]|uniref:DUF6634 family protein n=1 Tax=Nisaea sp. TaxID=2024842 RepID=UPI003265316D